MFGPATAQQSESTGEMTFVCLCVYECGETQKGFVVSFENKVNIVCPFVLRFQQNFNVARHVKTPYSTDFRERRYRTG